MRRIFAISDLHLSLARPKPMDVFGPNWANHAQRIADAWCASVRNDDLVLVPGDLSWALKLKDAQPDLEWIAALPGEKVFVKGNHDYWWSSLNRVRQIAGPRMHFLQNGTCAVFGHTAVGGTRLWDFDDVIWPPAPDAEMPNLSEVGSEGKGVPKIGMGIGQEVDAEEVRARELDRLRQSLAALPSDAGLRIAMVHHPPLGSDGRATPITAILDEHRIDLCVFGHLHSLGSIPRPGADCTIGRTRYLLVSCDWIGFAPRLVAEAE
jgi:uncharacterized protein